MTTYERFRESVAQAMAEQHLSYRDVARRLGYSRAWVIRLLNDPHKHGVKTRTMDEFCRELGITIDFTRGEK